MSDRRFPTRMIVVWSHPAFAIGHVVARNDAEAVWLSPTAEDYEQPPAVGR